MNRSSLSGVRLMSGKCFAFLMLLLFVGYKPWSQMNAPNDNIIPPSPEASALGKYVEIPVGLYTGVPNISIPVTTVKQGSLSLPVSLSYHGAGNKVEELASRTGLGWSLQAGGVITRVTIGQPDETLLGFLSLCKGRNPQTYLGINDNENYSKFREHALLCHDAQPDIFYFNVAGYTGKFAFDWNGDIKVESASKIKITYVRGNTYIDQWTMVVEDGTTFIFNVTETTEADPASRTPGADPWCDGGVGHTVSTWHLGKITSANLADEINFEYTSYRLRYALQKRETIYWRLLHDQGYSTPRNDRQYNEPIIELSGKVLSRITTSAGSMTVDFIAQTPRRDIPQTSYATSIATNYFSLDSIKVSSSLRLVQRFALKYTYDAGPLTLDEVRQCGADNTCQPPYRLDYSSVAMPAYTSYSQDHWGYFNGANNWTFLPQWQFPDLHAPGTFHLEPGANREVNPAYSQAGMLTSMTYPAGGRSIFEFEQNTYSFIQSNVVSERQMIQRTLNDRVEGTSNSIPTSKVIPFTLSSASGNIDLQFGYRFNVNSDAPHPDISPGIQLKNASGTIIFSDFVNKPGPLEIAPPATIYKLPPGNYEIILRGGFIGDEAIVNLQWLEPGTNITSTKLAGGLRIKRIVEEDGSSNNPRIRNFQYLMDDGLSSGVLFSEIQYKYNLQRYDAVTNDPPELRAFYLNDFHVLQSSGRAQLGTTQGSHVGYRHVTVLEGTGGAFGKSVYKYTSAFEHPDLINDALPFAPPATQDFMRGLLVEQTNYKKENNSFIPVKKINNEYSSFFYDIPAYKVGIRIGGVKPFENVYAGSELSEALQRFAVHGYMIGLGISRPKRTVETLYEGNSAFTTETVITYDPALQFVQSTVKKLEGGKELITENYYPFNYANGPSVRDGLVNRHMFPLIEQVQYEKGADGVKRAISGSIMEYKFFGERILPWRLHNLAVTQPVLNYPSQTASRDNYINPTLYGEVGLFRKYDWAGNLLEYKARSKEKTTYLWGYNNSLVVAQVENAAVDSVAYCDFEDIGQGGWSFSTSAGHYSGDAKTGKRSYNGATLSKNVNMGVYKVSLWAKGSGSISVNGTSKNIINTWALYEWILSSPNDVIITTNGNLVDGVRLHPREALMTTYTHDPLVGMTSVSSPNNTITFYEYDGLGRLVAMRDHTGSIVKKYTYRYGQ